MVTLLTSPTVALTPSVTQLPSFSSFAVFYKVNELSLAVVASLYDSFDVLLELTLMSLAYSRSELCHMQPVGESV